MDREPSGGGGKRRPGSPGVVASVATAGAWVFAMGSLAMLGWGFWGFWPGMEGSFQVMRTEIGGVVHSPLALTFDGFDGMVLLVGEAVVVFAAIVMSVLPLWRVRRVGHVLLILWVGLWLANATWFATFDPNRRVLWIGTAAAFGLFTVCTLVRAVRCCRLPARKPRKAEKPSAEAAAATG